MSDEAPANAEVVRLAKKLGGLVYAHVCQGSYAFIRFEGVAFRGTRS